MNKSEKLRKQTRHRYNNACVWFMLCVPFFALLFFLQRWNSTWPIRPMRMMGTMGTALRMSNRWLRLECFEVGVFASFSNKWKEVDFDKLIRRGDLVAITVLPPRWNPSCPFTVSATQKSSQWYQNDDCPNIYNIVNNEIDGDFAHLFIVQSNRTVRHTPPVHRAVNQSIDKFCILRQRQTNNNRGFF